jgi:hypothetical protein
MPYAWYPYTATGSSPLTYIVNPSWTTFGTAASVNWYPCTVTSTSASWYAPPAGWQWGWNQLPQAAHQPPSRAELDRMLAGERQRETVRRQVMARVTKRAETLLLSLLDDDQARSYTQDGWFEVRGSAGGRYRISRRGQAGNIAELPPAGGEEIASYCIHPSGRFPDADAHIAQYLRLVTDEEGFRQVANRTPRRRLAAGMAA